MEKEEGEVAVVSESRQEMSLLGLTRCAFDR